MSDLPTCGKCGTILTPENSQRACEYFLCDKCAVAIGFEPRNLFQKCDVCDDVRRQLKGHPDSRLDGENGLAAATMRRVEQLEDCCRIALWIRDRLEERGAYGAGFEEWEDIESALDLAAPAETASSLQSPGDEPSQSVSNGPKIPLSGISL